MLLGSTANHNNNFTGAEPLVIQLILQKRYAEAYQLLINQPASTTALYNLALCLHWSGNYQEAVSKLEIIQLAPQASNKNQLNSNSDYKEIKTKQNQTHDYLHGISEGYLKSFPVLVYDSIVRLKTDCWLQLGNYAKVIAIATPIAHKGYKNITDALQIAEASDDKRI
ncbi:hypothetical protein ACFQ3S_16165 [Mucilaginibacter terrae]|uniref:hypothetical protein n=1 Tax=Mucilaginibacter terrae TaxID=1955052 RepID=UPI0036263A43